MEFFNGLGRADRSLGVDSKWVVIDDGLPMSQLDAQIKPIMIVLSLSLLPPSRRDDIASSHTGVKHGNTPATSNITPSECASAVTRGIYGKWSTRWESNVCKAVRQNIAPGMKSAILFRPLPAGEGRGEEKRTEYHEIRLVRCDQKYDFTACRVRHLKWTAR